MSTIRVLYSTYFLHQVEEKSSEPNSPLCPTNSFLTCCSSPLLLWTYRWKHLWCACSHHVTGEFEVLLKATFFLFLLTFIRTSSLTVSLTQHVIQYYKCRPNKKKTQMAEGLSQWVHIVFTLIFNPACPVKCQQNVHFNRYIITGVHLAK